MSRHQQQRGKTGVPSQRQLKVGEEIRHALATIFLRGECHDPSLADISITVSEVRISPDLKNAAAYVTPLSGMDPETLVTILNEHAGELRHLVSQRVKLRYAPRITFKRDTSFDEAARIHNLIRSTLSESN